MPIVELAGADFCDDDGVLYRYLEESWATQRSHGDALSIVQSENAVLNNVHIPPGARGGDVHQISRYFMEWDTSSVAGSILGGTLKIRGSTNAGQDFHDVILLKAEQANPLTLADFEKIVNAASPLSNSDGAGTGTFAGTAVVRYSGTISTWSESAYNEILLASASIDDLNSGTFKCVLISQDFDYPDIAPDDAHHRIAFKTNYSSDADERPVLVLTTEATGNSTFFGANF